MHSRQLTLFVQGFCSSLAGGCSNSACAAGQSVSVLTRIQQSSVSCCIFCVRLVVVVCLCGWAGIVGVVVGGERYTLIFASQAQNLYISLSRYCAAILDDNVSVAAPIKKKINLSTDLGLTHTNIIVFVSGHNLCMYLSVCWDNKTHIFNKITQPTLLCKTRLKATVERSATPPSAYFIHYRRRLPT